MVGTEPAVGPWDSEVNFRPFEYYSGVEQAVEYGNIVVLVQYRLGIMGFFHYQDANGITHGGNYGLADMALGVKFIAENASKLGGDSEHIMINGESAGSGSVMALLLHDETGKSVIPYDSYYMTHTI